MKDRRTGLTALVAAVGLGLAGASLAEESESFVPTDAEARLFDLIRGSAAQQRTQIILDPRLCRAARKHAIDMQVRRYISHTTPTGVSANQRVIQEGFTLPLSYPPYSNNIESLAGSVVNSPDDAFFLWSGSPPHAAHIFGQTSFYRSQLLIGIGQANPVGLPYGTWVFVSAPAPPDEESAMSKIEAGRATVEIVSAAELRMKPLPPESIVEVWENTNLRGPWRMQQAAVTGDSGYIGLGPRVSPQSFFKIRFLEE